MIMKTKAAFQLVLFGLACWTLIAYFEASEGIASFFGTKSGGMVFELNLTPFILFVAASAVYLYLQKKSCPARKQLLLPDEFEEQDEREQMMTAKACRASYIAACRSGSSHFLSAISIAHSVFPYYYCVYHHDHPAPFLRHLFQEKRKKLRRAVIGRSFFLPACFFHTGNLAFMGQLPESDSGHFKLPHISSRASRYHTAVVEPSRC